MFILAAAAQRLLCWVTVTVCNRSCCLNTDNVTLVCVYMCSRPEQTWLGAASVSETGANDRWSHGKNETGQCKHKTSLSHTHTHEGSANPNCGPTVGLMMSFTCGAVRWQRPFCAWANTYVRMHTHTYIRAHSLPVHTSREQAKLNTHVASLCRGKLGVYHSLTVSFIKAGEQLESSRVVTKSPLTL